MIHYPDPPRALAPVKVNGPAEAPVTLADVKAHLRIDHGDDDALIQNLITSAVDDLDGWKGSLGICLMVQTWAQSFASFPCGSRLRLPIGPATEIVSVAYVDVDDAEQTLASTAYVGPLADALGGYIALKPGNLWPSTACRDDAVTVTFKAGADAVAEDIKTAIKLHVERHYDRMTPEGAAANERAYERLIAKHRRIGI